MEKDLRRSAERFRAIFEGSLDAIFLVDPETGIILDASPVASELLLRELDEIVGSHYLQLYPSRSAEEMKRGFDSLFRAEGRTRAFEAAMLRSDGTLVPIEALGQVIQIDGVPVIHGIVRDITDRKRMEEELLKTQKLESLGILAGGIAHDFNNILTAISTNISMARMYGNLEDDISQMMADAEKASFRARNLTQQLLAFSKGGAPVRKTVSILRILKENMEFALSGANVKCEDLSRLASKDLWRVEADEGQIGQVVHNLIINAIQSMPEGGVIKMGAENVDPAEPKYIPLKRGKYVRISITDHGVGIPKRYLQRVFDPFFTTKQKGSGLGLTTSFKIVRNHGGHIHVESEVGVGTTVTFYLPASDQESVSRERIRGGPPRGRGRVLLIDDEEMIRKAANEALHRLGYDVTLAEDGSEGIRLYEEALQGTEPFDAVLLDLTIPGGMGGQEGVRDLLRIDPGARVIASSGYSNDPVMANFRKYGFRDVIIKPYRIDELGEVLHKVIKEDR
jgi:PAS domain S-box-containing protein